MSSSRWSGPGWPGPVQEHLLRAAAGPEAAALGEWVAWRSAIELDDIPNPSLRLLPLAHKRLGGRITGDPDADRIKGIYRRSWTANQLLIAEVRPALEALRSAGIEIVVIKGAALSVTHYRDTGARWFGDVDLLVRHDDADDAHSVLVDQDWEPHHAKPSALMATDHGSAYGGDKQTIDLHWSSTWLPAPDDDVWDAAIPIELAGVPLLAPGAADQILQACVHGATWLPSLQLHWLADIATVAREEPGGVDWARLLDRARARRVVPWVHAGMSYAAERLGVELPDGWLAELAATPGPRADRAAYRLTMRSPSLDRTLRMARYVQRRQAELDVPGPRASGYVDWLRLASGYERRRDLVAHGVRRVASAIRPRAFDRSGA